MEHSVVKRCNIDAPTASAFSTYVFTNERRLLDVCQIVYSYAVYYYLYIL